MRVLLDENLDWRLSRSLLGHEVHSIPRIGWSGIKNGALLSRAQAEGFEVLITMDGSLSFQQNIPRFRLALIVLKAPSNRLADTQPLMPAVLAALPQIQPGTCTTVAASP